MKTHIVAMTDAQLMRLNRPIGIWLLMWPTLWGLWIAGEGRPDPGIFLIFVLGVIIMRSAGCVINDFVDRKYDVKVARTKNRPLALHRRVSERRARAEKLEEEMIMSGSRARTLLLFSSTRHSVSGRGIRVCSFTLNSIDQNSFLPVR